MPEPDPTEPFLPGLGEAVPRLGAVADDRQALRRAPQKQHLPECEWQRAPLPESIRALVLDDQRLRNDICWFAFS